MIQTSPEILKQLEDLLKKELTPDFLELKRLHNGLVSLKLVSKEFEGVLDNHQFLIDLLKKNGLPMPEGLLLFLYAPAELDEDELEQMLQPPYRGMPTWADALFLDPVDTPYDSRPELSDKQVVAFWGVKGGVGRTTTLAHVAALLSKRGKRVLAIDLDLDSPALIARLCSPEVALRTRFDTLLKTFQLTTDPDERRKAVNSALAVNANIAGYRINLLGQGFADADFVKALTGPLTPSALYRNNPLLRGVIAMAAEVTGADVILIDARSGFCEESAVSLLDLANDVFIFVSPSPSNFKSLKPGIEALERSRLNLGHPRSIHFVTSMLPAGADARRSVITELREVIDDAYDDLKAACNLLDEQIPAATPFIEIFYTPRIVENESELLADQIDGYTEIAERILPPVPIVANNLDNDWVKKVINEVKIPIPQAEDDDIETLASIFTRTQMIVEFSSPNITLVLGAKGTGKTFLKRLCLEKPKVLTSLRSFEKTHFVDGFWPLHEPDSKNRLVGNEILRQVQAQHSDKWSEVFSAMALAATIHWLEQETDIGFNSGFINDEILRPAMALKQEASITDKLESIMVLIAKPLLLDEAWSELNKRLKAAGQTICLIFDELDVALGETSTHVKNRKDLLKGLFDRMNVSWLSRQQIQVKTFLREDIFRSLGLEEEAKYVNRRVTLAWKEEDLWRLMVRAVIVGSPHFRGRFDLARVEDQNNRDWEEALALIWGERLGKSEGDTRTRVWAARRLSDGQSRLFPRAALWLLQEAFKIQKRNGGHNLPLLQPAALRESMSVVSKERFAELKRESSDDQKAMLDLLKNMKAYQNESEFVNNLERAPKEALKELKLSEILPQLIELGILEKGQRRDKTPTVRIVDLYAFNPDLGIIRQGRR